MILGIGTDLLDERRIEATILRFGSRFLNRLFTKAEQERMAVRTKQSSGYAKLFAAKEALLKALGTGLAQGIRWTDIEITREGIKAPQISLSNYALQRLTEITPAGMVSRVDLSLTDDYPYVVAFVVISAQT